MFGLGIWELVVILLVALLVLGPSKLPQVARQLGKGLRELRRAMNDVQSSFDGAMDEDEPHKLQSPPATPPEHAVPAEKWNRQTDTDADAAASPPADAASDAAAVGTATPAAAAKANVAAAAADADASDPDTSADG